MITAHNKGGGVVLAVVALAVSIRCILAREYAVRYLYCLSTVWDRYCNYQRWALDTLVFRFASGQSTVAEVTKEDFDGCAKGLLPANTKRIYELSPVTVTLTTASPLYLANTIESCEHQRLVIMVNVPTPPSSDASTSSP